MPLMGGYGGNSSPPGKVDLDHHLYPISPSKHNQTSHKVFKNMSSHHTTNTTNPKEKQEKEEKEEKEESTPRSCTSCGNPPGSCTFYFQPYGYVTYCSISCFRDTQ